MSTRRMHLQKGLAIVELAIVLPLLLLLMLAIAEFGRALYQYNALIKAVRDGARYMSVNAFVGDVYVPNDNAPDRARRLVAYGKIGGTGCTSSPGACQDLPGFVHGEVDTDVAAPWLFQDAGGDYYVTVAASYTYRPMLGDLPLTSLDMDIPFTASTTMRVMSP